MGFEYDFDGVLGLGGYYVSDGLLTVTVTDTASGIYYIDCTVSCGDWWAWSERTSDGSYKIYSLYFIIPVDGEFVVRVLTRDIRWDLTDEWTFKVDTTPPETELNYIQVPGVGSVVTLSATDSVSGWDTIMYSEDGTNWEVYDTPFTLSSGGIVDVYFYAIDVAGNVETVNIEPVEVDVLPPVTTYELEGILGLEGWYVSNVNVTLDATDDIMGVDVIAYSFDEVVWIEYTGLFTISGEGHTTIYFNATDIVGNMETTQFIDIYIDKTTPSTQLLIGTPSYEDVHIFVNSSTPLTLTMSDSISGLYSTYYRIDGGAWNEYAPFYLVGTDGLHTIDYYSEDIAGNAESEKSCILYLDNTAPQTTLILSGDIGTNDWFVTTVGITLVSDDGTGSGTSTIYYILDLSSPQSFDDLVTETVNGYHTIEHWSVDNLGNIELIATMDFKIDTEDPDTTSTVQPTDPDGSNDWYINPVTLSLSYKDTMLGVWQTYYQVNGGAVVVYSLPVLFSLDDMYTVEYWSVDNAGNTEAVNSIYFQIDQTAPVTTLTIGSPNFGSDPTSVSTSTEFTLSIVEVMSGIDRIEYSIDGGGWIPYSSPFTVSEIGPHTIYYRCIDKAGNVEAFQSIAIVVNASVLTYTGDICGNYSDPTYLEARLIDVATQQPIAGKMIHFEVGGQTNSTTTNSTGYAKVTIVLNQQNGTYPVMAWFDGDVEYLVSSSQTYEFTIEKETAYVEYTGNTVVPTTVETITLRATVFDDVDGFWGDLTKVYVTFRIYAVPIDPLAPIQTYGPYTVEVTEVDGVGVFIIEVPSLSENGYLIQISFDCDSNDYYQGPKSDLINIVVYEPTGDFVTGGGWIWDSSGNKGNFGFNVKYKKNGLPKGQAVFVYRVGDWHYIVKSNAWLGMAIVGSHSFFEAKCVVQQYNSETGEMLWDEGNYNLRIDVWDNAEEEEVDDVFQIRVYDKNGLLYYEAGFDPYGFLQGGNIVIHIDEKK